ncbi:MAG: ribosomal-processing cysteine protease Prp [Firmicutes bacterium]|nr:ribosomal-processing cysteine protease Prp [Bacillota bacterium]
MIRISLNYRTKGDNQSGLIGFSIRGHANFGNHGQDVVCAAISAIAQTAVLGLIEVAKISPDIDKSDGWLSVVIFENEQRLDIRAILDTMVTGIRNIATQYPKHIKIEEN